MRDRLRASNWACGDLRDVDLALPLLERMLSLGSEGVMVVVLAVDGTVAFCALGAIDEAAVFFVATRRSTACN